MEMGGSRASSRPSFCLQAGYAYVPYSSLESIIEQNKQGYYLALRQTQGTIRSDLLPNWQPWVVFLPAYPSCLKCKRLQEKVEHEKIMIANLPELSLRIIEAIRAHGRITISDATVLTGANRNTVKVHLRRLMEASHLEQHGAGRGVWYSLK
jgi:Fic family protein